MRDKTLQAGLWAAASAYGLWGVLPLYIKFVGFASPWEILAQRIVWSIPCALAAVLAFRAWPATWSLLGQKRTLAWLGLSAALIAVNWAVYVWAVANAKVMEASLAYFITPLVQVGVGVLAFKEPMSRWQGAALALAAAGVVVQGIAMQAPPWVALVLCISWTSYGLIRKIVPAPAAGGLLVETLALAPLAALGLAWLSAQPTGIAFDDNVDRAILLALTGVATAAPLMLFAFGARRLRLSTIGILQFIAPSLQFLIGLVSGELFTPMHALSFGLIWVGLILFVFPLARGAKSAVAL